MKKKQSTRLAKLVILAILGTISMILMFLNFPLPMIPQYLKIDFSDVPALLAALIFSPGAGILVEAVKNLLYLIYTGAGDPIGVIANFIAGILFIVPVSIFYHRIKGVKSLISGLVTSTIITTISMSVLNYYLILPAYSWFMGWDTMSSQVKWVAVIAGVIPFNLIKGIIIAILFIPLFLKMKPWIERKSLTYS